MATERRSADQDAAIEEAFRLGKLPEEDRRKLADVIERDSEPTAAQVEAGIQNPAAGEKAEVPTYPIK